MRINVSGHHVEVTDAIREAIDTRFQKVSSHFPSIEDISVTLTVEPKLQKVEANTQFLGDRVAVSASDSDMYSAISTASKKLNAALEHRKGSTKTFKKESHGQ